MTIKTLARLLVCGALFVPVAAASTSAQSASRTHVHDPEAEALEQLLTGAQAALDQHDFAAAAEKYQEYIAKKPDDAYAHFQLGYAYTALQRPQDAETEYAKAAELDPKMGVAYTNLGMTLLDLGQAEAAVEPLEKAAELEPTDAKMRFLVGMAFERAGKTADAIAQYEEAEKLDGNGIAIHLALGNALLASNRAADAETEFRAAISQQPESAPAQLGLARSLIAEKKFDEATKDLADYLKARPNDADARIERASLLINSGQYAEGLAELDRMTASAPNPPGQPDTTGQPAANKTIELRETSLRAQALIGQKNYAAAIPVLQKAVALAPNDAQFPAVLGHAYIETKNYPEAVRTLSAAFKMDSTSNDVLGDIITAEYLNKNYKAALQAIDLFARRKPLPLASWFLRASCYDKLGEVQQALTAYQKFLKMNTDLNNDMYFIATARVRTLERELKDKKR